MHYAEADGYGGLFNNSGSLAAGNGGLITITSNAGNLEILSASANGGYASSIGAGAGGKILLKATGTAEGKGNITSESLNANGGMYYLWEEAGPAGDGGLVRVTASRDIRIGTAEGYPGGVTANGGYNASLGGGAGGAGGTVSLVSTGGNITLPNKGSYIDALGGWGDQGGAGGTVVIRRPRAA
ncbi:hypothetical protein HK414_27110 [Ramlibacter terrae]|uniref:Autotransporter outer membrane beta-barrel domain-containing protein n=1 Tax=Ramlibacter terrae TaxID=2732511 RepID=A0ABX6P6B0_9BURK|nr:hypothetical protein HK414_27110 [Ramlibacter terrae]